MSVEKIVMVTRKTRLEGLIERFNTRAQARFYIEHGGGNFTRFEQEHDTYQGGLSDLHQELERLTKVQVIERSFLPNFLFAKTDLVLTFGIDGLVVNTAKYLRGQPLLAVNPDPAHIDGILIPFTLADVVPVVQRVLRGQMQIRQVTMAEALLSDGQSLLAFNDLFIGVRSHVSARYAIRAGGQEEHHSSSGIIVSTGAGATGWLSSLFNMASGMMSGFGSLKGALAAPALTWDTDHLVFVVREPFVSKTSGASIVCGTIAAGNPLLLESEMPDGGVIFSDGVETDFLAFNAGARAAIGVAARKTNLVSG
jgi:NAD kinase